MFRKYWLLAFRASIIRIHIRAMHFVAGFSVMASKISAVGWFTPKFQLLNVAVDEPAEYFESQPILY